jgi:hypothetical protein
MSDFDATAAFDRVLSELSIITCQRVGLPRIARTFMYPFLKDMEFHLITGFRKSLTTYYNTNDNKTGQGVLQGSSSACPIFILNSNVSLSANQKHAKGASFIHPISGKLVTDHAVQFMDDTSQFLIAKGLSLGSCVPESSSFDEMIRAISLNAQR